MKLIIVIILAILLYVLIGPKSSKNSNKVQKKSREDKFFDFIIKHIREDEITDCTINEGNSYDDLKFIHYDTETLSVMFTIEDFYSNLSCYNNYKIKLKILFEELELSDIECKVRINGTDIEENIYCSLKISYLLDEIGKRVLGKTFTNISEEKHKEEIEYKKKRQDATKKVWEQIEKGE